MKIDTGYLELDTGYVMLVADWFQLLSLSDLHCDAKPSASFESL